MPLSPVVLQILQGMSLEEKVGQVFVFTFVSLRQALEDLRLHPGGYIRLYSDVLTLARQTATLQSATGVPLLISADFERGVGYNVGGATDFCSMMTLGATADEDLAFRLGKAIATEAEAIGVNMNYVPVMDVNVNEDNPIINTRSLGGDASLVSRLGAAFIKGHREGGTLTCAKHFPGHGDTAVDSHTNLGTITADRERLNAVELQPFRAAIAAGVDAIMTAHLTIPAIEPDPIPATLSHRIMTGLLRDELGFEGVVTTDALEMGAISRNYPPKEAIVRAINAGCDMLIMPLDNRRSVKILLDAVRSGEVSEARLDEAVGRILTIKDKRGILKRALPNLETLHSRVGIPSHQSLALEIALKGTTLIHDRGHVLPIARTKNIGVVSFSNFEDGRTYFLEPRSFWAHLAAATPATVQAVHCGTLAERHPHEFGALDRAKATCEQADVVVVAAYVRVVINSGTVSLEPRFREFLDEIRNLGKPVIVVSFGSPYVFRDIPWASAAVCAYSATEACQEAAALLILGAHQFTGRLPVSISLEA